MRAPVLSAAMFLGFSVVATASGALRLFFSTVGAEENQSLLDANPNIVLPIPRTNPTVASGTRLYIWGELSGPPSSQTWLDIGFDVVVVGGHVNSALAYRYDTYDPDFGDLIYQRWQGAGTVINPPGGNVAELNMVTVTAGTGLANNNDTMIYDLQSEIGVLRARGASAIDARSLSAPAGFTGKATLLGWVNCSSDSTTMPATLFFRNALGFVTYDSTADHLYFGVGDENTPINGHSIGAMSPNPDGYVLPTPEPAAGIGFALLVIGCRRR